MAVENPFIDDVRQKNLRSQGISQPCSVFPIKNASYPKTRSENCFQENRLRTCWPSNSWSQIQLRGFLKNKSLESQRTSRYITPQSPWKDAIFLVEPSNWGVQPWTNHRSGKSKVIVLRNPEINSFSTYYESKPWDPWYENCLWPWVFIPPVIWWLPG